MFSYPYEIPYFLPRRGSRVDVRLTYALAAALRDLADVSDGTDGDALHAEMVERLLADGITRVPATLLDAEYQHGTFDGEDALWAFGEEAVLIECPALTYDSGLLTLQVADLHVDTIGVLSLWGDTSACEDDQCLTLLPGESWPVADGRKLLCPDVGTVVSCDRYRLLAALDRVLAETVGPRRSLVLAREAIAGCDATVRLQIRAVAGTFRYAPSGRPALVIPSHSMVTVTEVSGKGIPFQVTVRDLLGS